ARFRRGLADFMNSDYVRMVECGYGARLLPEASDSFGVLSEMRRQQLERHLPFQPRIERQIDLAHSSAPDLAHPLVMANRLPCAQFFQGQPIGGDFRRRSFDEILGPLVKTNKRFNLTPQLIIVAAGFGKKCRALRRPSIQRVLHQLIHLLPTFRSHKNRGEWGMGSGEWGIRKLLLPHPTPDSPFPTPYSFVISLITQAFAVFQPRVPVGTEPPSASAVSSRLRPPK